MALLSYRRHRFPPPLIEHAIWLYTSSDGVSVSVVDTATMAIIDTPDG